MYWVYWIRLSIFIHCNYLIYWHISYCCARWIFYTKWERSQMMSHSFWKKWRKMAEKGRGCWVKSKVIFIQFFINILFGKIGYSISDLINRRIWKCISTLCMNQTRTRIRRPADSEIYPGKFRIWRQMF